MSLVVHVDATALDNLCWCWYCKYTTLPVTLTIMPPVIHVNTTVQCWIKLISVPCDRLHNVCPWNNTMFVPETTQCLSLKHASNQCLTLVLMQWSKGLGLSSIQNSTHDTLYTSTLSVPMHAFHRSNQRCKTENIQRTHWHCIILFAPTEGSAQSCKPHLP